MISIDEFFSYEAYHIRRENGKCCQRKIEWENVWGFKEVATVGAIDVLNIANELEK